MERGKERKEGKKGRMEEGKDERKGRNEKGKRGNGVERNKDYLAVKETSH
jgi:hypothetical protein